MLLVANRVLAASNVHNSRVENWRIRHCHGYMFSFVSSKAFDIGLHLHVSKIAVYLSWCSCIHTRPRADPTAACHHGHATADDGTTRVRVPTSGSADQYIQRYGRVTYGNAYFTASRPTISAPACGKFQPNL